MSRAVTSGPAFLGFIEQVGERQAIDVSIAMYCNAVELVHLIDTQILRWGSRAIISAPGESVSVEPRSPSGWNALF